jgi:hypothetical protein
LIAFVTALPAAGQVAFGVRAGGAYSSLVQKVGTAYESGARFGYSAAGMMDIPLPVRKLSLRPEVAIVNQGGAYYSGWDVEGMTLHNTCRYYSLQTPVNLAFTFSLYDDVDISICGGPVMSFAFSGKMKSHATDSRMQFGHTEEKDLRTFDLGMNVGLAVEYSRCFFSVSSNCGVIDRRAVKREGESPVFQNNVTFSLGYFFRK